MWWQPLAATAGLLILLGLLSGVLGRGHNYVAEWGECGTTGAENPDSYDYARQD